jgi:hypothetical protein
VRCRYLSEDARVETRLLEELDSNLSGDDADLVGVGLPEQLTVGTFLIGG